MQVTAIIAEWNPLHRGHLLPVQAARQQGATHIAAILSGNFVQRGEPALCPWQYRAAAALSSGVDLVLQLPLPYAVSTAQYFAGGAVASLAALGTVDSLIFGSECGELAALRSVAAALDSPELPAALAPHLQKGLPFAAARQAAVEAVCPGTGLAALLDKPNNNLAVEYCKAILELGASLVPIPLPRQGAGHGQALTETGGQFASASALRTLWQSGGADAAAPYVPAEVLPLYREAFAAGQYTDLAAAQRCQLALLRSRCAGTAPFAQVRGISEGLEHRLEAAVRSSTTHAELLDSLTTVRYPRARMRRLAMDAALDYSADAFPALPPCLHLLGAQKDALPLLKAAALPVSHSLARLAEQNAPCRAVVDAQLRACDFGALCRKKPEPMGGALRQKIIFLTK